LPAAIAGTATTLRIDLSPLLPLPPSPKLVEIAHVAPLQLSVEPPAKWMADQRKEAGDGVYDMASIPCSDMIAPFTRQTVT
jgi:hypothetical protein